jgi:uncharacterized membrane protein YfcA
MYLIFPALGVVAGFVAGLLGLGGGVVMVPALCVILPWFGFTTEMTIHVAIGTSMAIVCINQVAAVLAHRKYFTALEWRTLAKRLWPGIITGAVVGALLAHSLPAKALTLGFGVLVILLAINVAFDASRRGSNSTLEVPWALPNVYWGSFWCAIMGGFSAILGLGGGAFMVPYLQHYQVPMAKSISGAAMSGLPLALMATLTYMLLGSGHTTPLAGSLGYVYLPAFFGIVITSMIFVRVGVKLSHHLSSKLLRVLFILFLLFVGIRMLFF